ncbi:MAG: hypothetical protein V7763_07060 [Sulfitobacter sp.]
MHHRIAHLFDSAAGILNLGFGLRGDGKRTHVHGFRELIEVLREAAFAKFAKGTAYSLAIVSGRFSAPHASARLIEENSLDVRAKWLASRHLLESGLFLKTQAQRKRCFALRFRLSLGGRYLIEIMA